MRLNIENELIALERRTSPSVLHHACVHGVSRSSAAFRTAVHLIDHPERGRRAHRARNEVTPRNAKPFCLVSAQSMKDLVRDSVALRRRRRLELAVRTGPKRNRRLNRKFRRALLHESKHTANPQAVAPTDVTGGHGNGPPYDRRTARDGRARGRTGARRNATREFDGRGGLQRWPDGLGT